MERKHLKDIAKLFRKFDKIQEEKEALGPDFMKAVKEGRYFADPKVDRLEETYRFIDTELIPSYRKKLPLSEFELKLVEKILKLIFRILNYIIPYEEEGDNP